MATATGPTNSYLCWPKTLNQVGLAKGFYKQLLKEDDWFFVIKMSALIEVSCTFAICAALDRPELEDAISYIELANLKYGKLPMLLKLSALEKDHVKIISTLAELRNKLAHDVSMTNFSFSDYIGRLDKNQRSKLVRLFGHGISENLEINGKRVSLEDFVVRNPKIAMWGTFAEIIACLNLEKEKAQIRNGQIAYKHALDIIAPIEYVCKK